MGFWLTRRLVLVLVFPAGVVAAARTVARRIAQEIDIFDFEPACGNSHKSVLAHLFERAVHMDGSKAEAVRKDFLCQGKWKPRATDASRIRQPLVETEEEICEPLIT